MEQNTIEANERTPFRLAKNSLLLFSSQVCGKSFFFFTMVFLARVLGPTDYGKVAFAYGLVSVLSVLTRFGMDVLTTRDVAEDPGRASAYFKNNIILRLLLSALFLLAVLIALWILAKPPEVNRLVFLLAIAMIFQSLAAASTSLLEAVQAFRYRALLMISMYALIFLGVLLAHYYSHDLHAAGYGFLIGSLIYAVLALTVCHLKVAKIGVAVDPALSIQLLRMALPLVLSELFVSIYYRVDVILLSLFDTDQVVGWYDAAYNFVYGLRLLPISISAVLLPTLASDYRKDPQKTIETYSVSMRYSVAIGFLLTFQVAIASDLLIALFFGKSYRPSSEVLPVLIWACAIMFANALQTSFLVVVERRVALFRATAIGALSNVILNLLLIPKWSMYGAAWATVLSEMLVFLISAQAVSEFLGVRRLTSFLARPIVATLFMTAAYFYIGPGSTYLKLFVMTLLYVFVFWLTGGLPRISVRNLSNETGKGA